MAIVTQPPLIPRPWASNGAKYTIPDTTTQFGRASWSAGFPSETAQPLGAGGIPPNWLDFQGVLYALSQHATFEQVGGRYAWSNTQNYPVGACIIGSNGTVYQALQESGPGTSAGAKNPTNSSNAAYWEPVASPDGQTIILDANGRLKVSASGLADGTTIVNNNGKISVGAPATATLLADGTTITANNGKLTAVGEGAQPDGTTIVFNASSKLSVGAPATAALLADGTSILADNGKLSVAGTEPAAGPGFFDPSTLYTFEFSLVTINSPSGSGTETRYYYLPFDSTNISASSPIYTRYWPPTNDIGMIIDADHNYPYFSSHILHDTDGTITRFVVTAPIAWWQKVVWDTDTQTRSDGTHTLYPIIPVTVGILSPLPPMDFGSTATANLSGIFASCERLQYVTNNLFRYVQGVNYSDGSPLYSNLDLTGAFAGTVLNNIPESLLVGLSGFSGNVVLANMFSSYSVTFPMTLYIDSKNVSSAGSMFASHTGANTVTFKVPAGSTTYTTLSTAYSGTNWITVAGV